MALDYIRDAVAVMAVRNAQSGGIEIRVSGNDSASCWVAVGPVLDADMSPRTLERCKGLDERAVRRHFGPAMTLRQCMAYWVAATRALYVRTGQLACSARDPDAEVGRDIRSRLAAHRAQVETAPADFACVLESEGLYCDLRALLPFTRWSGSRDGSQPTDMRIFLAAADPLRKERHLAGLGGTWLTPEALLLQSREGRTALDFMTYSCLRVLSDFSNVETLAEEYGYQRSQAPSGPNNSK